MSRWRLYLAFAIALAVVGFISSRVQLPDNRFYLQASERMINPGCAEIHCFRVLVPWTIGVLPGNEIVKWKAYAVLANAGAALAVFDLCLFFGLTRRASIVAGALSAFGFSSFGTIWQPYQSDPLMFWWAPIVMRWALEDRMAAAGLLASVGVFAKEFIVVPLGIAGIAVCPGRPVAPCVSRRHRWCGGVLRLARTAGVPANPVRLYVRTQPVAEILRG
jgi:hypothetical protein